MRFWWVNHKQTARQELSGGYLWSPKREAKARSQFYDNMRRVEPGDIVLSYSDGLIRHKGIAQDFAFTALKPDSFGTVGDYWAKDGWLLPVQWRQLEYAIRPRDRILELGPLLPNKYSPINPATGYGNQKAYLAEISQSVVDLLLGSSDSQVMAPTPAPGLAAVRQADDAVERQISEDAALETTVKQQLILARSGQGIFRSNVLKFEASCRLTGVINPRLLVASHIKPWRVCSTASERLDGANGLLLTPHVDRLFDRGYISFMDDGTVIVSGLFDPNDLAKLGLERACGIPGLPFQRAQQQYLEYHRKNVFL